MKRTRSRLIVFAIAAATSFGCASVLSAEQWKWNRGNLVVRKIPKADDEAYEARVADSNLRVIAWRVDPIHQLPYLLHVEAYGADLQAAETRPLVEATYKGVMTGYVYDRDRNNPHYGDTLFGSTEISFSPTNNEMRIRIRNIRNVTRNGAFHTTRHISFRRVSVDSEGGLEFTSGTPTHEGYSHVHGWLQGSGHTSAWFEFSKGDVKGDGYASRVPPGQSEAQRVRSAAKARQSEAQRVRRTIKALLKDATFDNTRNAYVGIDPGVLQTSEEHVEGSQKGACGLNGSGQVLTCTLPDADGNSLALRADLRGGETSNVPPLGGHDIQLTDTRGIQRATRDNSDVRRYGGWMEHSGFYLYTGVPAVSGRGSGQGDQNYTVVDSLGAQSGSAPSEDASYRGVMVGTPVPGETNHGDVLVGDAKVAFEASSDSFDIHFTNIINMDRGGVAHSVSSIALEDEARVVAGGEVGRVHDGAENVRYEDPELADGSIGRVYDGAGNVVSETPELADGGITESKNAGGVAARFYGSNHEEIAGHFSHSKIIGAFGAKRQTE